MNLIRKMLILSMCCLLFGGGTLDVFAQSDYNPSNPAEPTVIDFCKIAVSANYPEGAYVNGGGKYKVNGSGSVYISTSARNTEDYTYTFQYWTLNGEVYSYSRYFYYYPQKGEMNFVAHYEKKEVEWDPANPSEPSGSSIKRKYMLYLSSNIDEACSFNIASGEKRQEGTSIYLRVYVNPYYRFDGWKVNGTIISRNTSFYYTMPRANTTIEAQFTEIPYDPESPIDPPSQNPDDVDNIDSSRKLVTLIIGNADYAMMDKTRVVFNDERLLSYESDCDAAKFVSDDAAYQIYSLDANSVKYQINERPTDTGIVPLGIIVKMAGSMTISTSRLDCEDAVLVDKVLKVEHPLAIGGYTFTSAVGTFEKRFELRVPSAIIPGDVNGDGSVTIRDIVCLISYLNGGSPDGLNEKGADADGNGTINVYDVRAISNMLLGKK